MTNISTETVLTGVIIDSSPSSSCRHEVEFSNCRFIRSDLEPETRKLFAMTSGPRPTDAEWHTFFMGGSGSLSCELADKMYGVHQIACGLARED